MNRNRAALIVFISALVLVPATATAASAHHYPTPFRLARVPLQKAQLGPAAAAFALNYGSGPIPNGAPATAPVLGAYNMNVVPLWQFFGRVAGYALDYGDPLTGSTGVTEIRTGVEKYKSRTDAKVGLKFWRSADSELDQFSSSALPETQKWLKPPAEGQKGFASLVTFAAANLNPIVQLDEQVADGRYILDLTVTAGSVSAAKQAAPGLLRALDRRLHRDLAGKPTLAPPKIAPERAPGQADGGPDLSAAAFQLSDVGQSHWAYLNQDYVSDPFALSNYGLAGVPAVGLYDGLGQNITWWPTATEATYAQAYQGALLDGLLTFGGSSITPVDLSALSDPAKAVLIAGGSGPSFAVIDLTRGQAGEHVLAQSDQTLKPSDVQSLAQAAADRLDAAIP